MRIGLTQRVTVIADRDERRDSLDQAWARLLLDTGYVPVPLPNQPGRALDLCTGLGLDGVILTGGNDLVGLPDALDTAPERDAFERELLGVCAARGLAVLGVCRGMQLIVRHWGGSLMRVEDHVRKPHPIVPRGLGIPTLPRAEVNSFHSFGTQPDLLPADLIVAGMAPDGIVEAVMHRALRAWGIMWHPERPVRPGCDCDERDVALIRALFGGKHA